MTLIIVGIGIIVLTMIVAVVNMVTMFTNDRRTAKSAFVTHGVAIIGMVLGLAFIAIGILLLVA